MSVDAPEVGRPVPFAALGNPVYRPFVLLSTAALLADNVEHVITYYAAFQRFHSATLGGFAVIAHWAPYLLLSIPIGTLADRYDPRRLIQAAMVLFSLVSLTWAVLLATGSLRIWEAELLLVAHGLAGVCSMPAAQVLLYSIVGPANLPSAVRLSATLRYLAFLVGPGLGSLLLLEAGPALGLCINAAIYLPYLLWLQRAPRPERRAAPRVVLRGFADVRSTLAAVRGQPVLVSMVLLAGAAAFFIGNAYQAQMPLFANDLGHLHAGATYAMLLGADACGALLGGLVLESTGWLRPSPRTAVLLAMAWCGLLAGFATTTVYPVAVACLLGAGFVELAFSSMAQALVQLHAPNAVRGRVIGIYVMASLGLRTFSGFSVGLLGGAIGVHASLALSAVALCAVLSAVYVHAGRARREVQGRVAANASPGAAARGGPGNTDP